MSVIIDFIIAKLKEIFIYLNKKIKVFNPNTAFIRYFNFLMVIIELFAVCYLPMQISFAYNE